MAEPNLEDSPTAHRPVSGAALTPAGYRAALTELLTDPPGDVADRLADYLAAHSGLPGPRANLALVDAFAAVAPGDLVRRFARSDDEYLALCGAEGLGRLCLTSADRPEALVELRLRAADQRWRVREGAARALQLVGDTDPTVLHAVINEWTREPDLWLARAAVAAICEPRLLNAPAGQQVALLACERATALLLGGVPPDGDRPGDPGDREAHRVLRQALGYAWSVAVAASPNAGLAAFGALAARDEPDARWIVRSNLTKKRLRSVLTERNLWEVFA